MPPSKPLITALVLTFPKLRDNTLFLERVVSLTPWMPILIRPPAMLSMIRVEPARVSHLVVLAAANHRRRSRVRNVDRRGRVIGALCPFSFQCRGPFLTSVFCIRHLPLVSSSGLSRNDTIASLSVTKVGSFARTSVYTMYRAFIKFITITTASIVSEN